MEVTGGHQHQGSADTLTGHHTLDRQPIILSNRTKSAINLDDTTQYVHLKPILPFVITSLMLYEKHHTHALNKEATNLQHEDSYIPFLHITAAFVAYHIFGKAVAAAFVLQKSSTRLQAIFSGTRDGTEGHGTDEMNGFNGWDGQWAVDSVFREIVIVFYLDCFLILLLLGRLGWPGFLLVNWDDEIPDGRKKQSTKTNIENGWVGEML